MNTLIKPQSRALPQKEAKKMGLHSITHHYLPTELWMSKRVIYDLRRSNIKARVVVSSEPIKGAVEVWRA